MLNHQILILLRIGWKKTLKNRFSVDIEYSELEEMKYSGNGTYGKGTWFVAIITPKL